MKNLRKTVCTSSIFCLLLAGIYGMFRVGSVPVSIRYNAFYWTSGHYLNANALEPCGLTFACNLMTVLAIAFVFGLLLMVSRAICAELNNHVAQKQKDPTSR